MWKGDRDTREAGEYIECDAGNIAVSIPGERVFYYVKSGHVSEIAISDAPEKTCARVFLFHNPFRGPSRAPIFWQHRDRAEKGFNERDWILSAGRRNSEERNSLVETLGTPFDHINTINLDGKHDSYYRHSTTPSLPSVPDKFTFFLFSVFVLYGLSTARKTRDITITGSKIPVVEY